ncbi:unnamed protein product, partial [Phaeothamnion confervicola]
ASPPPGWPGPQAPAAPTLAGKGGGDLGLRRRPAGRDGDPAEASAAVAAAERRRSWQVRQDLELQQHSGRRVDEAHAVERMVNELGQMFGRFSQLVAQQEELVVHIEDDFSSAHVFASEGQANLARYYQIIKGNRGLV